VNLAFLAPDIIENIIAGHQPADLNVEKFTKGSTCPWNGHSSISYWGFKLTDKIPDREKRGYYGTNMLYAGFSGQLT
jgi:hypothetical protein